jgi:hypothetical protein
MKKVIGKEKADKLLKELNSLVLAWAYDGPNLGTEIHYNNVKKLALELADLADKEK